MPDSQQWAALMAQKRMNLPDCQGYKVTDIVMSSLAHAGLILPKLPCRPWWCAVLVDDTIGVCWLGVGIEVLWGKGHKISVSLTLNGGSKVTYPNVGITQIRYPYPELGLVAVGESENA